MTSSLRTIAGHRLVAGLGHGGMARVYLAISQKPLGFTKLVVLKVLREELDVDGDLLEMFSQEARLAARLNHLHVVQTYEAGEDDGRLRIPCDALQGLQYVHDLTDYELETRADHADRALDGAAATRFQLTETGATLAAPVIPVVAAPRWRAALTWAGPFALAALATSLVIQRIDHATGHAELAPPRATRVEPSATAREPEPNRLRPLDGNPWETPK